ncbi:hypothetical protein B7Z17_00015 [Candidatus Saccharibacteria bacterium 32-49-10]|nr:MAG: hypothetical protein B7Z17_00015 [Candidatus Saccharibacteria bacterium 32-49-10]
MTDVQDEIRRLYACDEERYRKSHVPEIDSASQTQIGATLTYFAHSLEKGLSSDNFETGRGFTAVQALIDRLNIYKAKGYDTDNLAYVNALSVLHVFHDRHKNTETLQELEMILGGFKEEISQTTNGIGGSSVVSKKSKKDNSKKNFKELAEERFSIRSYSDKSVAKEDILDAIAMAAKTPTVCNRQGVRVYVSYNKDVIRAALKIQGGLDHYDAPPVLLLVTSDDSVYTSPNERNQGFIDGGLYAMSVLYALEYKGLAACPLNAMFGQKQDAAIRKTLTLPEGEKLITFISVGHFKDENNICKSFRFPVDEIVFERNSIGTEMIPATVTMDIGAQETPQSPKSDHFMDAIRKKVRIRTRLTEAGQVARKKIRIRTRVRAAKAFVLLKKRELTRSGQRAKLSAEYQSPEGVIITLNDYANYGNMIQRYALQHFLAKSGHKFISYDHGIPVEGSDKDTKTQYLTEFADRYMPRKDYEPHDEYSVYIVGSDQVWRNWWYKDIRKTLGFFFFNFLGNKKVKRIAYAASFGKDTLREADIGSDFVDYARPLVKEFDAISVRERSGAAIMKKTWNVHAELVSDPTMLLESDDYDQIIRQSLQPLTPAEGIFTYIIAETEENTYIVSQAAAALNIEVGGIKLATEVLPPIEQWLKGIRDAKLVVTDSFHGTVFSIINNTPFIVVENSVGGAARIENLLELFNINKDRLVKKKGAYDFNINQTRPINWGYVNTKLAEMRKQSGDWLLDAIRK